MNIYKKINLISFCSLCILFFETLPSQTDLKTARDEPLQAVPSKLIADADTLDALIKITQDNIISEFSAMHAIALRKIRDALLKEFKEKVTALNKPSLDVFNKKKDTLKSKNQFIARFKQIEGKNSTDPKRLEADAQSSYETIFSYASVIIENDLPKQNFESIFCPHYEHSE